MNQIERNIIKLFPKTKITSWLLMAENVWAHKTAFYEANKTPPANHIIWPNSYIIVGPNALFKNNIIAADSNIICFSNSFVRGNQFSGECHIGKYCSVRDGCDMHNSIISGKLHLNNARIKSTTISLPFSKIDYFLNNIDMTNKQIYTDKDLSEILNLHEILKDKIRRNDTNKYGNSIIEDFFN